MSSHMMMHGPGVAQCNGRSTPVRLPVFGLIWLLLTTASSYAAPVIDRFDPQRGPVGSFVILTGSGFTGATEVTFNGVSATVDIISDTRIVTRVPAGAASG